jgi:hypothetical protein
MSVNVKQMLKSPLVVGACITTVITVTGTVYALLIPRSTTPQSAATLVSEADEEDCKTVVFDPKPPLNVRDTPNDQPGNIVATLQNGEILTVVSERDGWLQVSKPVVGWVYEKLTQQSCDSTPVATVVQKTAIHATKAQDLADDHGSQLFEQALSNFQDGNLPGAIKLAHAVPVESPAYDQAQAAIKTMPKTWNRAKSKYDTAERAMANNRWNDILTIATDFPDIRFWREKLTPMVKKAIQMHYVTSRKEEQ